VRWPSGIQQIVRDQKGDHEIVIDEPAQSDSAKPVAAADKPKP
jgi:hypothetical protein